MDQGGSGKMSVGLYLYYKLYSVCVCSVAQLCLTLCYPRDCSPPGYSVHRIFQARTLEWVAMPSSRASSQPRDQTRVSCVSCIAGRFFPTDAPGKPYYELWGLDKFKVQS